MKFEEFKTMVSKLNCIIGRLESMSMEGDVEILTGCPSCGSSVSIDHRGMEFSVKLGTEGHEIDQLVLDLKEK